MDAQGYFVNDTSPDDRWYVTNGVVAVGPVAFDLLTRGVAHGRIPAGSFIRHDSWKMWRPLDDIGKLTSLDRARMVSRFAEISAGIDERASSPHNEPPPPPKELEAGVPSGDVEPYSRPSVRPAVVDPVRVLASAADLEAALGLALSTSVQAAHASVGLLHRYRRDLGCTVTSFAHGTGTELLLGEKLAETDPSLAVARAGHTIIAEPHLGEAGRYIAGRLRRCTPKTCGFAMVPLVLFGELVAVVELGKCSRLFRARDIARVEDVLDALAERVVDAGWIEPPRE